MGFAQLSGRETLIHRGLGRQALSLGHWPPLGEEGSKHRRKLIQEVRRGCALLTEVEPLIQLCLKLTPSLGFLAI